METSEHQKPRLLVIDDDPLMHRLFSSVLQRLGYEVLIATSGRAGIQMAAEHLPQLIILDYVMPDMDGMDTLKELKSLEQTRSIPVLMATGYLDAASNERFLAAGAAGCVGKPFEAATLIQLVQKLAMDPATISGAPRP